ncbi:helix-turn-helix domain-containing protein [Streptomyces liangshanensis]|uniref:Helix-turn-helix domain-containing protein n=1 Tax=Streptomyces liangshanensis TaxID=2717324 RepID=A0A6G9GZH8_9ACTN|nr:helix-turn-helix transcriptional regulator [Streptomyces liangshanensis]QIQ03645.1 helix-turn-helix domain-containing protein [Streptomyces liangshanensis]
MVGRVPEPTGAGRAGEFAELLLELKERSGLSYGALAKRLHMSTSSLHRYCSGIAVPAEYAPAERLARVCRATPGELVELHRRWILADAARRGRSEPVLGGASGGVPGGGGAGVGRGDPAREAGGAGQASGADPTAAPANPANPADPASPPPSLSAKDAAEPVVVDVLPGPGPGLGSGHGPGPDPGPRRGPVRRRRTALIASVAVAAVLGAAALAAQGPFRGGQHDTGAQGAAGATAVTPGEQHAQSSATASPPRDPSGSGTPRKPSGSAPASLSPSATTPPGPDTAARDTEGTGGVADGGGAGDPAGGGNAVPLNVGTRPYIYDNPCSQHFLVDSEPEQVGPPASEQDAPRWAAAYGAVSSGEQRVALTVQGTGRNTVVLEALHVRVVAKGAPLAWNDYAMGVGCGGGVETKSFDVDLDNGSPTVRVKNGQRDFPYKVSESDPEIFYITAHAAAHDVRWDLSLEWSSGGRRGTVHIDNAGTPFRTSAGAARPGYDYPLGGGEWIERQGG